MVDDASRGTRNRETNMRAWFALAVIVTSLMMGMALTACSDDSVGNDYFENDTHRGYPGPGVTTPGRDS
jgi:hypothetical protein